VRPASKAVVLDASTVAKWLPPLHTEPLAAQALELLQQWMRAELAILVPDLIFVEVANLLWKTVRKGRCTRDQATAAMQLLLEHELRVIPSHSLLDAALGIAVDDDRTVYDRIYVALAARSEAQLITADERLANALAGRYAVRWLGTL
jgi:predicted nucleic acid-binding protein